MESQGVDKKSEWNNEETSVLLKKYTEYLPQVGPLRHFRTKIQLWEKISEDLKDEGYAKTALQCENRYKTVLKRKQKVDYFNKKTGNPPMAPAEFTEELEVVESIDDTVTPPVIVGPGVAAYADNSQLLTIKPIKRKADAMQAFLELSAKKERNRERRHQEKMENHREKMAVLRKILEQVSKGEGSDNTGPN